MRRLLIAAVVCATLRGEIVINGNRKILGWWDATAAARTKPVKTGTVLPGSCEAGEAFFKTDGGPNRKLYLCGTGGAWETAGYSSGTTAELPATCTAGSIYFSTDAQEGRNLYLCGASGLWTQMAGAGAAAAVTVGSTLPATCDSGSLFLKTDGPDNRQLYTCSPANTWSQVAYGQGTVAARPSACDEGQIYFATDAAAGQNLYFCTQGGAPGTWTQMTGGGTPSAASFTTAGSEPTLANSRQWADGKGTKVNTGTAGKIMLDKNPFDRSYVQLREDWMSGGEQFGSYGWAKYGASVPPAVSDATTDFNHPGVLRCTAATNDGCWIDSGVTFAGLGQTAGWELQSLMRVTDITQATVEFGLSSGINWTGGNSILLRFDAAAGPNWKLRTCADSTCNLVDTGVAAAASQWHRLRLRMTTAGTVSASVDGTEVSTNATVPSSNFYIVHGVQGSGVSRSMDIDFTAFEQAATR